MRYVPRRGGLVRPKPGLDAPALHPALHGPIASGLAIVGTHVLVVTRRF
jgi:hypothetical protein